MRRPPEREDQSYRDIPFMSLAALLIPMLLMGAQFITLGTIDSALPALCGGDCSAPTPEPTLELSVAIGREGLTVSGNDDRLAEPVHLSCTDGACASAEAYDTEGLVALMADLKDRHPDEQSYVVVPDSRVPFEVLIGVFDAARGSDAEPLFPSPVLSGGVI